MEIMSVEERIEELDRELPPVLVCGIDGCEFTTVKTSGMGLHKSRIHGVKGTSRSAKNTAKAKKVKGWDMDPDAAFETVARATQVLFPKGVPYDRILEVAELQKAMLRVISS